MLEPAESLPAALTGKPENNIANDIQPLSFEKAMAELELLVRRLEEGRLGLEEAINAYERGTALRNHCESKLRAAKLKVEYVLKEQQAVRDQEPD